MSCAATECSNPIHGKGLCRAHYMRLWRYGTLELPIRVSPTIAERIQRYVKIDPLGGCWLWNGAASDTGYGVLRVEGRTALAHRLSYETHAGAITPGFQLDHLCRIRLCVNPLHLEAVTPRENTLRSSSPSAENARKTHCPRGHFLDDHAYIRPDRMGRFCAECARSRRRERARLAGGGA